MPRPSTPISTDAGYSMLEVLVATTVSLALATGAVGLALSARRTHDGDRARTRLDQSLLAAKEFLVTDARQAGERLGQDFPALVLVRGEDLPGGSAGDPDELSLRRNLSETVLRVCQDADPTQDEIVVALKGASPPPGCAPLPVDPGDALPSNLEAWSDFRVGGGGRVSAYLYDPVTGLGEFFTFSGEGETVDDFFVRKPGGSPAWQNAYPAANGCRVYLLEERRYRLDAGLLEIVLDEDAADPIHLVDALTDFQVRLWPEPTAALPSPAPLDSFDGIGWKDLRAVELTLNGATRAGEREFARSVTIEVTPRNAL